MNCPICKRKLTKFSFSKEIDYSCTPSMMNHHYAIRFLNKEKFVVKFRLTVNQEDLMVRINYHDKFIEIWGNNKPKIKINYIFEPDFTNLDKLFNKIKAYVAFL